MQQFRNLLKGWVGKLLLAIFILPFAFFGIEGIILNSGSSDAPLSVNGVEISKAEIDRSINAQRETMVQRMGGNIDRSFFTDEMLRPRVIEMLIQKQLLAQAVKDEGLAVSNETIKNYVRGMSQFKDENGEFSQEKFETVLARAGYTGVRFFDELSSGMVAEQLQQGIGQSAFVTESELKTLVELDGQKRSLSYATLKIDQFKNSSEVTGDDVAKFFEENISQYRTQEKVKIRYLTFKPQDFASDVVVSDDELLAEYDHYVKSLNDQERRRASHILVEVNDDRSDADAKTRIEEVKAKLASGQDFATLAREYSDDSGTASAGGDLDFAGRGIYDEAFDNTLFGLKDGAVSDIVKTEFGYHIIKLTGIEHPPVAGFDEKKADLRATVAQGKASEKLNELIDELNRLTYESGDLTAIAEKFGKSIEESASFTQGGGSGIAADKKVVDAAYSDLVLKEGANSEAIELADGSVVVLRVSDHEPARDQTLEEVRDQVLATVKLDKARAKAKETAEEIVDKLNDGALLETLADAYTISWTHEADVGRQNSQVSRTIVSKLFEMPKPATGSRSVDKISLPSGDQEILVLSRVADGEFNLSEDETLQASLGAGGRVGQLEFENYLATLKENAEIIQK